MSHASTTYISIEIPTGGGEWDELEFEVEFTAEPHVPACFNGHPDNWTPAEAGTVEFDCFTCLDTGVEFECYDFEALCAWIQTVAGAPKPVDFEALEEKAFDALVNW